MNLNHNDIVRVVLFFKLFGHLFSTEDRAGEHTNIIPGEKEKERGEKEKEKEEEKREGGKKGKNFK